jgi:proteasome lid subunit RPN8/RPN11
MATDLLLSDALVAQITAHAEAVYPEECCGILVGTAGRALRRVEAENVAAAPLRRRRYVIPPELLLAVHREVRGTEEDVVGYYHSHPDRPAEPSAFDLEHALAGTTYLIAGLDAGRVRAMRCWRLGTDGESFVEESWTTNTS